MSNSKRILAALLAMIGIAGYFFWKKKNEKKMQPETEAINKRIFRVSRKKYLTPLFFCYMIHR